jgi:transcriptional regulator with XRE-family HTH domain
MTRPDPLDLYVGRNIRRLRLERGLSEAAVALALGEPLIRLRAYEAGTERIGSRRLAALARILDVTLSAFFEDSDAGGHAHARGEVAELLGQGVPIRVGPAQRRAEVVRLRPRRGH